MKILIIDDTPSARGFLSQSLKTQGHEVSMAWRPRDFEYHLAYTNPDVIIIDLEMEVDGKSVAVWVGEHFPKSRKIIYSGETVARVKEAKKVMSNCITLPKDFEKARELLLHCVVCTKPSTACSFCSTKDSYA